MPKPAQSSEAVIHDSEGARKDGSNGVDLGSDVKGGGAVGAIIWQQDLVCDHGDSQGPDRVQPSAGVTDNRDDRKIWGRQIVGVPIGRGGNGIHRAPPNWGVHQEAADNHSGEGGLPPCLCNVYGGVANARDDPVGGMVGSRRGK